MGVPGVGVLWSHRAELGFIPSATALGHWPFCLCAPLHGALLKPQTAVGRAGPVYSGVHRASPWALGNILGTGVKQMRSAVPSVGYRNWVVLKRNVI